VAVADVAAHAIPGDVPKRRFVRHAARAAQILSAPQMAQSGAQPTAQTPKIGPAACAEIESVFVLVIHRNYHCHATTRSANIRAFTD
jgi:hypothetical protein